MIVVLDGDTGELLGTEVSADSRYWVNEYLGDSLNIMSMAKWLKG